MQPGNTLFSIAIAVESTVAALRDANCLTNVNQIIAGDILYVPQAPVRPVRAFIPTTSGSSASDSSLIGCTNPSVRITSPTAGQTVTGQLRVVGNATLANFWYYKLEIRADTAVIYNFYSRSEVPVLSGQLGIIDTSLFSPGLYWLRLAVVDNTGAVSQNATCVIPMIIQ